jgi:hypothetical protein
VPPKSAGLLGRTQPFTLKNVGDEPVFSDFQVTNPQSGNRYRVAIRGVDLGENFCACPDFATDDLGTCKHIEFVFWSTGDLVPGIILGEALLLEPCE